MFLLWENFPEEILSRCSFGIRQSAETAYLVSNAT